MLACSHRSCAAIRRGFSARKIAADELPALRRAAHDHARSARSLRRGAERLASTGRMPEHFAKRFGGIARLFGTAGLERLRAAHVCVIGVGGVGSWTRGGARALGHRRADDDRSRRRLHHQHQPPAARARWPDRPAQDRGSRRSACALINPGLPRRVRRGVLHQLHRRPPARAALRLRGRRDRSLDQQVPASSPAAASADCRCSRSAARAGKRDGTAVRVGDLAHIGAGRTAPPGAAQAPARDSAFPANARRDFGVRCVYSPEKPVYPWTDGTCRIRAGARQQPQARLRERLWHRHLRHRRFRFRRRGRSRAQIARGASAVRSGSKRRREILRNDLREFSDFHATNFRQPSVGYSRFAG